MRLRRAMGSTAYGDIKLGSKDGGTIGTLKCRAEGIVWESTVSSAFAVNLLMRAKEARTF